MICGILLFLLGIYSCRNFHFNALYSLFLACPNKRSLFTNDPLGCSFGHVFFLKRFFIISEEKENANKSLK